MTQCWCVCRGNVVAVSVGCEYIVSTRDSGIVSSADDVLEMSVVREVYVECVRSVCGVCEMCYGLARGGRRVRKRIWFGL